MKHILIAALMLALSPSSIAAHNSLTRTEVAAGWELLFDGKSTAGWRTYQAEEASPGWEVINGELTLTDRAGDLITIAEYADFAMGPECPKTSDRCTVYMERDLDLMLARGWN